MRNGRGLTLIFLKTPASCEVNLLPVLSFSVLGMLESGKVGPSPKFNILKPGMLKDCGYLSFKASEPCKQECGNCESQRPFE
jgi:hypothetical protein